MKNIGFSGFLAISAVTISVLCLFIHSCASNGRDEASSTCCACPGADNNDQYPCEFIVSGFEYNDNCLNSHEWGFQSVSECQDVINTFLNSDAPCDQAVGECLHTIEKYADDCARISPDSCDEAWAEWTNCLAIGNADSC